MITVVNILCMSLVDRRNVSMVMDRKSVGPSWTWMPCYSRVWTRGKRPCGPIAWWCGGRWFVTGRSMRRGWRAVAGSVRLVVATRTFGPSLWRVIILRRTPWPCAGATSTVPPGRTP